MREEAESLAEQAPLGESGIGPLGDVRIMDHHARCTVGAMTACTLEGGTEALGEIGLVDSWHHVGAGVDEGAVEVVAGWRYIAGL